MQSIRTKRKVHGGDGFDMKMALVLEKAASAISRERNGVQRQKQRDRAYGLMLESKLYRVGKSRSWFQWGLQTEFLSEGSFKQSVFVGILIHLISVFLFWCC